MKRKLLYKLLGNSGTAFFGPLVSGNVAETLYDIGLTFEETIIIAGISSVFVTGLVLSREVERMSHGK